MADSRRLLTGLTDYRKVLGRHLSGLRDEFAHLDSSWRRFNSVSEGDYADQFRGGWSRTAQRFQEYIEETEKIAALLDERIEYLRQLNKTESGFPG